MSEDSDVLEVAAALTAAFETGDLEAIAELYADDVVVWHNFDQLDRTREQALSSAAWVAAEIEGFTVDDRWVSRSRVVTYSSVYSEAGCVRPVRCSRCRRCCGYM